MKCNSLPHRLRRETGGALCLATEIRSSPPCRPILLRRPRKARYQSSAARSPGSLLAMQATRNHAALYSYASGEGAAAGAEDVTEGRHMSM